MASAEVCGRLCLQHNASLANYSAPKRPKPCVSFDYSRRASSCYLGDGRAGPSSPLSRLVLYGAHS